MKLNTLLLTVGSLAFASAASAAISFSGNAFSNAPGIQVGDVAVLIFDNNPLDGVGFDGITFDVGDSLVANSTYGNFTVATNNGVPTSKTAATFGSLNISGSFSQIDISVSSATTVNQGDTFAWIVFKNSTTTVLEGDTYTIYTHASWIVPADGGNYGFNATVNAAAGNPFQQANASTAAAMVLKTGTVSAVPEPSSFAAFAGLAAVGFGATRRRRSV